VAFGVGSSRYGIDLRSLLEVINMVALTPVPGRPERPGGRPSLAGLINVRGQVLPVLSMRSLLALPDSAPASSTRILLVRSEADLVGLVVDSVEGVIAPEAGRLAPVESKAGSESDEVLSHVYRTEAGLILLLDVPRLLRTAALVEIGRTDTGTAES
jgi:purine-binding chemotaxis protein CheW